MIKNLQLEMFRFRKLVKIAAERQVSVAPWKALNRYTPEGPNTCGRCRISFFFYVCSAIYFFCMSAGRCIKKYFADLGISDSHLVPTTFPIISRHWVRQREGLTTFDPRLMGTTFSSQFAVTLIESFPDLNHGYQTHWDVHILPQCASTTLASMR